MFSPNDDYEKKIYVYLNGDFLTQAVEVKQPKRMKDIRRAVVDQFNFHGSREFRLFNEKGVELFEEDLEYLESESCVYASKGAEFDTNSCLSEYDLVKVLGEGGFGKVMLGVHKKTKEKVAIKILHTNTISNAGEMDQIFREAEVMQSLEHQNIVKIKKCLTIRSQVVFIMEYMEGGELLERVEKQGKFTEQESQVYFKQIVSAMAYCHQNKLIHRDLKLENLLCTKEGEKVCKVGDFGIAGVATTQSTENIDAGSLRYMAPEVLSGKLKTPSTAVDIWAMGVILYSMLVGDLPFHGKDTREIIDTICEGNYEIPKDIKKKLSPEVLDVMNKCLEIDYTKRIRAGQLLQMEWLKDKTIENMLKKQHNNEEIKEEDEEQEHEEESKKQEIVKSESKESENSTQNDNNDHNNNIKKSNNLKVPTPGTRFGSTLNPKYSPQIGGRSIPGKKTSISSTSSSGGGVPRYLASTKSSANSSKARTPGGKAKTQNLSSNTGGTGSSLTPGTKDRQTFSYQSSKVTGTKKY